MVRSPRPLVEAVPLRQLPPSPPPARAPQMPKLARLATVRSCPALLSLRWASRQQRAGILIGSHVGWISELYVGSTGHETSPHYAGPHNTLCREGRTTLSARAAAIWLCAAVGPALTSCRSTLETQKVKSMTLKQIALFFRMVLRASPRSSSRSRGALNCHCRYARSGDPTTVRLRRRGADHRPGFAAR